VEETVWTGPVQKLSVFAEKAGIADVQPLRTIEVLIKKSQEQRQTIHFIPPYRPETSVQLSEWLSIPYQAVAQRSSILLIEAVIAQRSYKSTEEVNEIDKAVDLTSAMQLKAIQLSQQGMKEYEIAAQLEAVATGSGGYLSFPIILTVNGQYLHNHAGGMYCKMTNGPV